VFERDLSASAKRTIPVLAAAFSFLLGVAAVCEDAAPEEILETGFVSLKKVGERIVSLRFDGTGQGRYGMETIAPGGALTPVANVELIRNVLSIKPTGNALRWEMPFVLDGYYDADAHLNYPDPRSTEGATPLILPFRCFVGSSGQVTRIEHLKRLDSGDVFLWLNIENGSRLLMQSDDTQNWDLDVLWSGCERLDYTTAPDRLTFANNPGASGRNVLTAPLRIETARRGSRETPMSSFVLPSCTFKPDFAVAYGPTGKTISASRLMTEFLRQGIYWAPVVNLRGEWVLGAVETHMFDDPRTYFNEALRCALLHYLGFIGYDRFEHFGHIYQWGRYPDYGAGGWLNKPPGNAPADMRMLQNNGIWVHSLVQYVLATRDAAFLHSRRARWLATDGAELQPLCGADADAVDFVLSAGDVRLDGRKPHVQHSLGQSFTATAPFGTVRAKIGNPAGWLGVTDLQGGGPPIEEPNHARLALYDHYGGRLLAEESFSVPPDSITEAAVRAPRELDPGSYYLELTDEASGTRYFSPGVTWATELDSAYRDGESYSGPFHGDVADMLRLLFSYMRSHMGAAESDMTYYQNDPEYNVPDQKSGRNRVGQANSFWEGAGNGYDAYQSLWYPVACAAMAEMAELLGNEKEAASYREMRERAVKVYNDFYWYTLNENGREVSRYFQCQDWDGVRRDYGYAYNNLEAAARGIAGPQRSRQILWWLDRGQYSPDGGKTWKDDIYGIWELAPPYSTIGNVEYLPVSGTLPYKEVVSNGGSRPEIAARDLAVRSKYLSIDNMHERNKEVLARYASPDRLTGGRTFPHWIGRWQFLGPPDDLLDFEGFREIFPQGGSLASLQPAFYLGFALTADGLVMRPRVPSELQSVRFNSITYGGAVLDFEAKALRTDVEAIVAEDDEPLAMIFKAKRPFNKTGLQLKLTSSHERPDTQVSIVLERRKTGGWQQVALNWYSHVRDGQWVWVDAGQRLSPWHRYRVRLQEVAVAEGGRLAVAEDSNRRTLQIVDERTEVTMSSRYNPSKKALVLSDEKSRTVAEGEEVRAILGPDEKIVLWSRLND